MKLFQLDGHRIEISEEAFAIKPFRIIWNRDRSDKKLTAYLELCYIFFMCDPRSDFDVYQNVNDKHLQVVASCGLKEGWQPDAVIKEGMAVYKKLSESQLTKILEASKYALNLIVEELNNIDLAKVDAQLKPVYKLDNLLATINKIPSVMKTLVDAEKIVRDEIARSKMEAGRAKTIGEDGFENY
jgi:hypothetical protein